MAQFRNEAEFQKALERLNAFSPVWGWSPTSATKDHTDAFGVHIEPRETYYKKSLGPNTSSVEKLSRASMEKLLYLTVGLDEQLEAVADQLLAKRNKELNAAIKALEQ